MFKLKKQYGAVQVTTIGGVAINLGGSDIKKVTPARGESASVEVVIKGASQAQLKQLYHEGHPLIEEVSEVSAKDAKDAKDAKEVKKVKDVEIVLAVETEVEIVETVETVETEETEETEGIEGTVIDKEAE